MCNRPIAAAILMLWGALGLAAPARAHPTCLTAAIVTVEKTGEFQLTMQFDTLAYALNDTSARIGNEPMDALLAAPRADLEDRLAAAKRRFGRGLVLTTDRGPATVEEIEFPEAGQVYKWRDEKNPILPVVLPARMRGRLPAGAGALTVRFPAIFDQVILTVERPGEETTVEPVEAGMASATWPLRLEAATAVAAPPAPVPAPGDRRWVALGRYVEMGAHHILAGGVDHVLFVLGLFLLSPRLRPLLWQTTTFTVAHSITLALTLFGVLRLPGQVVGPLIALSIAAVAVENLLTNKLRPRRLAMVFFFGLVHGLDFATALTTLGLPRRDFLTALIGFNAGVELGQIAVVLLAFATLGLLREWPGYRRWVVRPASAAIAVVALWWMAQRLAG